MANQNVQMNDFEMDQQPFAVFKPTANGTYPTLSPLIQLHIKRLYVTGVCDSDETLFKKVLSLDNSVDFVILQRFLQDHKCRPEWLSQRETFLQKQYDKYIEDTQKLAELIDEKYDRQFERVRAICEQQLEHAEVLSERGVIPVKLFNLKSLTETLGKSYLMQRLARGMSTDNVSIKKTSITEESPEFQKTLDKVLDILDAKVVDAQVLNPA